MIKKLNLLVAVILLIGLMSFLAAGCQNGSQGEEEKVKAAVIWSITDPERAGGWDRSQHAGYQVLEDEFGWELSIAEGVPYGDVAKIAADYAERDYDIVIFPDNGMIDAWKEVAPQYPDTWFVMMSNIDDMPDAEKVAAWYSDPYVWGNIVGAVGAKISEPGVIGVVGGVPIKALAADFSGIIEGAKAVDPEVKVEISFVGDWDNVANHSEVTKVLTERGADVLYTVSGPATKGVYEAAEAAGAFSIGYASDFYDDAPGTIATSVLIDHAPAYREMAEAYLAGTLAGKDCLISNDCIGVADFRGAISEELETEILQMVEDFKSGKIVIPEVMHPMD